ncbi:unnamed protein product [Arctogadus glacialis]
MCCSLRRTEGNVVSYPVRMYRRHTRVPPNRQDGVSISPADSPEEAASLLLAGAAQGWLDAEQPHETLSASGRHTGTIWPRVERRLCDQGPGLCRGAPDCVQGPPNNESTRRGFPGQDHTA